MRVLCLDIEGGYGGSSRSLYFFLKYVDRDVVNPEVWCKRSGPVSDMYKGLGIPCEVHPEMPKFTSVPRFSRNVYITGRGLFDSYRAKGFFDELVDAAQNRFDLVHFNHEGLYHLAKRLKKAVDIPVTMHLRTRPPQSMFARYQARTIGAACDRLVYITGNEREHFEALGGECEGEVIYNIVDVPSTDVPPLPEIPQDGKLNIASISNFSYTRGVHLLVDVAEALVASGNRDVRFVVAGKMEVPRSFPGELGDFVRSGGSFEDFVESKGLSDMFLFLGHVSQPERVLAACPALIKLELGLCPWSRDILEAMAFGRAVLTVGTYDRFITHGETGVLLPEFDAVSFAHEIGRVAEDRDYAARLGVSARERVLELCDGTARARDLVHAWNRASQGRAHGRS